MSIRCGAPHTPQWSSQELRRRSSIIIALIEAGSQIVALEIGVDVSHQKGLKQRLLERWETAPVVHSVEQRCHRREEIVEDTPRRVVDRIYIGDSPVMIDLQIRNVTLGTSDPFENLAASFG